MASETPKRISNALSALLVKQIERYLPPNHITAKITQFANDILESDGIVMLGLDTLIATIEQVKLDICYGDLDKLNPNKLHLFMRKILNEENQILLFWLNPQLNKKEGKLDSVTRYREFIIRLISSFFYFAWGKSWFHTDDLTDPNIQKLLTEYSAARTCKITLNKRGGKSQIALFRGVSFYTENKSVDPTQKQFGQFNIRSLHFSAVRIVRGYNKLLSIQNPVYGQESDLGYKIFHSAKLLADFTINPISTIGDEYGKGTLVDYIYENMPLEPINTGTNFPTLETNLGATLRTFIIGNADPETIPNYLSRRILIGTIGEDFYDGQKVVPLIVGVDTQIISNELQPNTPAIALAAIAYNVKYFGTDTTKRKLKVDNIEYPLPQEFYYFAKQVNTVKYLSGQELNEILPGKFNSVLDGEVIFDATQVISGVEKTVKSATRDTDKPPVTEKPPPKPAEPEVNPVKRTAKTAPVETATSDDSGKAPPKHKPSNPTKVKDKTPPKTTKEPKKQPGKTKKRVLTEENEDYGDDDDFDTPSSFSNKNPSKTTTEEPLRLETDTIANVSTDNESAAEKKRKINLLSNNDYIGTLRGLLGELEDDKTLGNDAKRILEFFTVQSVIRLMKLVEENDKLSKNLTETQNRHSQEIDKQKQDYEKILSENTQNTGTKIERLRKKTRELSARNQSLTDQLKIEKNTNVELAQSLSKNTEVGQLNQTKALLEKQNNDLTGKFEQTKKDVAELTTSYENLVKQLDELKKAIPLHEYEKQRIENEIKDLNQKREKTAENLEKTLSEDNKKLQMENEELLKKKTELNITTTTLAEEITKKEAQLMDLGQREQSLLEQIGKLTDQKNSYEEALSKLKPTVEQLEGNDMITPDQWANIKKAFKEIDGPGPVDSATVETLAAARSKAFENMLDAYKEQLKNVYVDLGGGNKKSLPDYYKETLKLISDNWYGSVPKLIPVPPITINKIQEKRFVCYVQKMPGANRFFSSCWAQSVLDVKIQRTPILISGKHLFKIEVLLQWLGALSYSKPEVEFKHKKIIEHIITDIKANLLLGSTIIEEDKLKQLNMSFDSVINNVIATSDADIYLASSPLYTWQNSPSLTSTETGEEFLLKELGIVPKYRTGESIIKTDSKNIFVYDSRDKNEPVGNIKNMTQDYLMDSNKKRVVMPGKSPIDNITVKKAKKGMSDVATTTGAASPIKMFEIKETHSELYGPINLTTDMIGDMVEKSKKPNTFSDPSQIVLREHGITLVSEECIREALKSLLAYGYSDYYEIVSESIKLETPSNPSAPPKITYILNVAL